MKRVIKAGRKRTSEYTVKFYQGKKLIVESHFDPDDYEDGDGELTPTRAALIAHDCAQMIEEAIDCNPPSEVEK
jgi:hypothetical protein